MQTINIAKRHRDTRVGPGVAYCGRSRQSLGLGNPYSHKEGNSKFRTASLQETLHSYEVWLRKLMSHYKSGTLYLLEDWEYEYLSQAIQLKNQIVKGQVHTLMCWCVNHTNYVRYAQPVSCHTQILFSRIFEL